jgi:ketosteroid isomerase-like protein
MSLFAIIAIMGIAAIGSIQPNPTDPSSSTDKEELIQIEGELAVAWPKGDKETIDRILAPDWSVTNALGQVQTKEQVMRDAFQSGTLKVRSATVDEIRVRLFGNTAVVTGRSVSEGLYAGKPFSANLRFTDVFVRRRQRWQAVASHASAIQP